VEFDSSTVLVFDSYYTSSDSTNLLRESVPKVSWVRGVNRQRFQMMADTLEEKLAKSGHWVGMYNTEHQECFIYSYLINQCPLCQAGVHLPVVGICCIVVRYFTRMF